MITVLHSIGAMMKKFISLRIRNSMRSVDLSVSDKESNDSKQYLLYLSPRKMNNKLKNHFDEIFWSSEIIPFVLSF
jgi:hypothetical protein